MIGYHPDYDFLQSIGIDIHTNEYGTAPVYNRETFETNVENCFIAGVIAAGNDANTIFIENGKYHGGIITQSILAKNKRRSNHNFLTYKISHKLSDIAHFSLWLSSYNSVINSASFHTLICILSTKTYIY